MDILAYTFMQRAFVVAIVISIITPLIGNVIVFKRLSSVGDALSHSSLAGVAIGLVVGINPLVSAVIFSILAGILIEIMRKNFKTYSELSTSIVMSLGVGIAAVLSGFVKTSSDFDSFLFGSISAVSPMEMKFIIIIGCIVFVTMTVLYQKLMYICLDEEAAKISGINVNSINFLFTIITAVVVAVSSRTVGALIISSLIVIPVACAMQVSKSYFTNVVYSIIFAMIFTISGLFLSFYLDLKPGGTIVLIAVAVLMILLIVKNLMYRIGNN